MPLREMQIYGKEESKENREKHFPAIEVEFFLGPHETAEDAKLFLAQVTDKDIIGFEGTGLSAQDKVLIQGVSDGEELPFNRSGSFPGFSGELFKGMRGLKKPIIFADLPEGFFTDLYELAIADRSMWAALLSFRDGDLKKAIQQVKKNRKLGILGDTLREKFIAHSIERQTKKFIQRDGALRDKASVEVLYFLGLAHTPILNEMNPSVGTHMAIGKSYVYPRRFQVSRLIRRGGDVPDTLYTGMIAEEAFFILLKQKFQRNNSGDKNTLAQSVLPLWNTASILVSRLNESEIRTISDTLGKIETEHPGASLVERKYFLPEQIAFIEHYFQKKGITLPNSPDKLINFIRTKGPLWRIP